MVSQDGPAFSCFAFICFVILFGCLFDAVIAIFFLSSLFCRFCARARCFSFSFWTADSNSALYGDVVKTRGRPWGLAFYFHIALSAFDKGLMISGELPGLNNLWVTFGGTAEAQHWNFLAQQLLKSQIHSPRPRLAVQLGCVALPLPGHYRMEYLSGGQVKSFFFFAKNWLFNGKIPVFLKPLMTVFGTSIYW